MKKSLHVLYTVGLMICLSVTAQLNAQNCAGIIPTYAENFDTFPPTCWQEATGGSATSGPPTFGSSAWTVEEFAHDLSTGGGAVNILMSGSGTRDWLVTPEFDLSGGGYEMNFDSAVTAVDNEGVGVIGSDDFFALVFTPDGGTTWSILYTIDASTDVSNTRDGNTIDLSGITSSTVTFAILADTGSVDDMQPYDFHLDDFVIETSSDCSPTDDITIDDVGSTWVSVHFETTNNGATGNYQFALTTPFLGEPSATRTPLRMDTFSGPTNAGLVFFTIGNGTGMNASLDPETDYDLYIREECTPGNFTPWSPRSPLTTTCNTIQDTFPVDINFVNHTPGDCWREAGDGTVAAGPTRFGESFWRGGRAYTDREGRVQPSNAVRLNKAENEEWLISGVYDVNSSASNVLSVEVAVTTWDGTGVATPNQTASMGVDDEVRLLYRDMSGSTPGAWQELRTWNASNTPPSTGQREFVDLSNITGLVEFAFFATDGDIDDAGIDYDFHTGLFFVDSVASINEVEQSAITLFPNPVGNNGELTIQIPGAFSSKSIINVIDSNGRVIRTTSIEAGSNSKTIRGLENLSDGVYLLTLENESTQETFRFVKN